MFSGGIERDQWYEMVKKNAQEQDFMWNASKL